MGKSTINRLGHFQVRTLLTISRGFLEIHQYSPLIIPGYSPLWDPWGLTFDDHQEDHPRRLLQVDGGCECEVLVGWNPWNSKHQKNHPTRIWSKKSDISFWPFSSQRIIPTRSLICDEHGDFRCFFGCEMVWMIRMTMDDSKISMDLRFHPLSPSYFAICVLETL